MNAAEAQAFLEQLATGLSTPPRTPILRRPDEVGLAFEDVSFPARDGVRLEGWFIPAGTSRIVVCTHFGPANRQGYPGHLEGFPASGGLDVDFLPKYRALHDAGYNVLAFDFRSHGTSSAWAGGRTGNGIVEWRDVLGALDYVRSRPDTTHMEVHLQSLCMGANATIFAMAQHPEAFADVASTIFVQPLVGATLIEQLCGAAGIDRPLERFDPVYRRKTSFRIADQEIRPFARSICTPALVVQVKEDLHSRQSDIQSIFDAIPHDDKDLIWIEGTSARHYGYTYFAEHPEPMIAWYDAHRGGARA